MQFTVDSNEKRNQVIMILLTTILQRKTWSGWHTTQYGIFQSFSKVLFSSCRTSFLEFLVHIQVSKIYLGCISKFSTGRFVLGFYLYVHLLHHWFLWICFMIISTLCFSILSVTSRFFELIIIFPFCRFHAVNVISYFTSLPSWSWS